MEEEAQHHLQTNRNLLLSAKAEADSLPGLEILANEVKRSHEPPLAGLTHRNYFIFAVEVYLWQKPKINRCWLPQRMPRWH